MKKPLILLVDDDRAVLQALEAALSPAFESFARIEGFEDPHQALEAAATWRSDGRPLAVAVVDQKMPELPGVDLVRKVRLAIGESPGEPARMRAILLTGQGGLDVALRAKNDAAVDLYVEKPWDGARLEAALRNLLRRFLAESGRSRFLVQRVATDPVELVQAFRLRYRVYRATPGMEKLLKPNRDQADLDGYDGRSVILVLAFDDGVEQTLVGTVRLVTREASPQRLTLREAASRLPDAGRDLDRDDPSSFPMVSYWSDGAALDGFFEAIERDGGTIAEVGRHAVAPEHRSGGTDRHQIEGTVAFFPALGLTHAVAAIPILHFRHYRALGFEEVPGASRTREPLPGMAIWSELRRLSETVASRIRVLNRRLERPEPEKGAGIGSLCFCPSYPECLPGPYLTDDFREVDVLCPRIVATHRS